MSESAVIGVADELKGADDIYLFGPGEAKGEFAKIAKKELGPEPPIAKVEPADKMTENQLVAKVRAFYA